MSTPQRSARKIRRRPRMAAVTVVLNPRIERMRNRSPLTTEDRLLSETVRMTEERTADNERRTSQRFKISAPVTVVAGEHEIPAYTRDLSNRGVYFYLSLGDSDLINRDFEFLVEMPAEITLSVNCKIRCKGKLVRKEVTQKNLTGAGIAAQILDYSIIRESEPA